MAGLRRHPNPADRDSARLSGSRRRLFLFDPAHGLLEACATGQHFKEAKII